MSSLWYQGRSCLTWRTLTRHWLRFDLELAYIGPILLDARWWSTTLKKSDVWLLPTKRPGFAMCGTVGTWTHSTKSCQLTLIFLKVASFLESLAAPGKVLGRQVSRDTPFLEAGGVSNFLWSLESALYHCIVGQAGGHSLSAMRTFGWVKVHVPRFLARSRETSTATLAWCRRVDCADVGVSGSQSCWAFRQWNSSSTQLLLTWPSSCRRREPLGTWACDPKWPPERGCAAGQKHDAHGEPSASSASFKWPLGPNFGMLWAFATHWVRMSEMYSHCYCGVTACSSMSSILSTGVSKALWQWWAWPVDCRTPILLSTSGIR